MGNQTYEGERRQSLIQPVQAPVIETCEQEVQTEEEPGPQVTEKKIQTDDPPVPVSTSIQTDKLEVRHENFQCGVTSEDLHSVET